MASVTEVLTAILCLCVAALGEPLWYDPTYQVLGPSYQPSTLNGPIHLPLHRSAFNDIGFGSTLGISNIGFEGAIPGAMFEEQQGKFGGGQFPVSRYDFQAGMIAGYQRDEHGYIFVAHQGDFNGGMLEAQRGDVNEGVFETHQGGFNGGMFEPHQGGFIGGTCMLTAHQEIIHGGFQGGVFGDMIGEPYGWRGNNYGSGYMPKGMGHNGGFMGDNYRFGYMQKGIGANVVMASNGAMSSNTAISFNSKGKVTNQGRNAVGRSGIRQDKTGILHKQKGMSVNTGNTRGTSATVAPQTNKGGNVGNDKGKKWNYGGLLLDGVNCDEKTSRICALSPMLAFYLE